MTSRCPEVVHCAPFRWMNRRILATRDRFTPSPPEEVSTIPTRLCGRNLAGCGFDDQSPPAPLTIEHALRGEWQESHHGLRPADDPMTQPPRPISAMPQSCKASASSGLGGRPAETAGEDWGRGSEHGELAPAVRLPLRLAPCQIASPDSAILPNPKGLMAYSGRSARTPTGPGSQAAWRLIGPPHCSMLGVAKSAEDT